MQTTLAPALRDVPTAAHAARLIGACVHCGFCNAACPTYRLLGDELDGPRGRIYLVRGLLEAGTASAATQQHLDRCLTCRACETACPSGVEYGGIIDAGRELMQAAAPRDGWAARQRALLRGTLKRTRLLSALLSLARACRPLLPAGWQRRIAQHQQSRRSAARGATSVATGRRVLRLAGCVQPALLPGIGAATTRLLGVLGFDSVFAAQAGCCGALPQHLDDPEGALEQARRNIDAWWPAIEAGAEAIVVDASACSLMLREYGARMAHDAAYAGKAARVSALVSDLAEFVAREWPQAGSPGSSRMEAGGVRVAFQSPCTLQHGLRVRGVVEALLTRAGAELAPVADGQQCCGSAGAWSLLEPALAAELRDRKLAALGAARPDVILSANLGCIAHLGAGTDIPVQHWVEWVADRIEALR
ncbi:MAG: glycolate oxidase subunit GlcF [Steroidobacteraceae bacterium]